MTPEIVLLSGLWIAWCILHSAMISESGTRLARLVMRDAYKYYRLLYNIFAGITFVGVLWYYSTLELSLINPWPWPWWLLQAVGICAGLIVMYLGAKVYNNAYFFGFEQIRKGVQQSTTLPTTLGTEGILNRIRHPYYTAGILILLFVGDGSSAASATQIILIAYLYIGTVLEERKLINEFGDAYREYMDRVPRFLPKLLS